MYSAQDISSTKRQLQQQTEETGVIFHISKSQRYFIVSLVNISFRDLFHDFT